MPIEDVDYLLKNSDKDANLLFIDSSTRNKEFYPFPHTYSIDFENPFTNVFGIDILDALIPSTMYNVESFNNRLKYQVASYHNLISITTNEDDAFAQILMEVSVCPQFQEVFKSTAEHVMLFVDKSYTHLIESNTNNLDYCTIFVRKQITVSTMPVKTVNKDNQGYHYFKSHDQYYAIPKDEFDQLDIEVKDATNSGIHVLDSTTCVLYTRHNISYEQYMTMTVDIADFNVSFPFLLATMYQRTLSINIGNYDVNTIQTFLQTNMTIANINPFKYIQITTPNASGDSSITQQMRIAFSLDYSASESSNMRLFIDIDNSSFANSLGFAVNTSLNFDKLIANTIYKSQYFKTIQFDQSTRFLMGIPDDSNKVCKIESPGIVNLTSNVRYMLLRCPEIETHLHNSFAFGRFCPGVGLFKHTGNNDQNNYRFDFTNFVKKPFHPIGKLRKITLKFELADGTPYDFKGVDHIILLSIKFYNVRNVLGLEDTSLLNPNYNPDYIQYFIKKQGLSSTSDDDDLDAMKQIVKLQNQYDYSSEEEFGDPDDNEEIYIR